MGLIVAQQNRGLTRDIVINDANGDAITPTTNDQIRVMIGRTGETPKLTVTGTVTANGSVFTKNSPTSGKNRLRIDASDLALIPTGCYTLLVDYFDKADSSEWKTVDRQVLFVEET